MLNAYIISTEQTRKPHSLLYYENTVLQLQISQRCQSCFALRWDGGTLLAQMRTSHSLKTASGH